MVDRLRLCLRGTRFSEPPPDINGSALADHGSMFSFLSGEQFLKATIAPPAPIRARRPITPLASSQRKTPEHSLPAYTRAKGGHGGCGHGGRGHDGARGCGGCCCIGLDDPQR
jgi:hypothetical protein